MDHPNTAFPSGPGSAVEEPDLIMACKVSAATVTLSWERKDWHVIKSSRSSV